MALQGRKKEIDRELYQLDMQRTKEAEERLIEIENRKEEAVATLQRISGNREVTKAVAEILQYAIPEVPERIGGDYYCPKCHSKRLWRQPYCNSCGKKLDWSIQKAAELARWKKKE